jgi:methionyl-tRNA formyltransferase
MRIIFMGTAEFAVPALKALINSEHEIVAVYTAEPKPQGRNLHETKTPIHIVAEENNIKVLTPKSLKPTERVEEFRAFKPDIAIVAAYGLILRKEVLDIPKYGCLNIHPSLLPRWRGAAPIQRTIEAGDKESAVCIMQMDEGMDTGPILKMEKFQVNPKFTSQDLHDFTATLGARLLLEAMDNIDNLKPLIQSQDNITYAKKITKEDGKIDFTLDAKEIEQKIRAFYPWPSCYFSYKGEVFKVLEAEVKNGTGKPGEILTTDFNIACGKDILVIKRIQRQGKKVMEIGEFARGFAAEVGGVLEE